MILALDAGALQKTLNALLDDGEAADGLRAALAALCRDARRPHLAKFARADAAVLR